MARKEASKPIKDIEQLKDIRDYLKAKNERDYVLFMLGIMTGYRAGDLVRLKVRDIKEALEVGKFIILESKKKNSNNIKEKNKRPRKAEIIPELDKILREYIRNKSDYEYMFPSRKGNSYINVERVSKILKEAANFFNMKNITAHSMRKTYAYTIYINNDKDLLTVKELLGHSSINETKAYLGLDEELKKEYIKALKIFTK